MFLRNILFSLLFLTFVHYFAFSEINNSNATAPNSSSKEAQQMCLDIQSGNRYLLVIGLLTGLSSRFVVISISSRSSEDYYVHELQASALNTAIPVLFISNEAGAPLANKWPLLFQTMGKYFFKADQLITLQISGGRECVYLPNPQKGIAFDIQALQLINLTGARPVEGRWLSAAQRMTFYSLFKDQQRLCKYTFDGEASADGTYRVNQASPYYYICKGGNGEDEQKVVRLLETECKSPVSWSILNGFADETQLYLFEASRVHILPLSALNGSSSSSSSSTGDHLVTVATYSLSSFIHCPGQPMPTTTTTTTTTPPSHPTTDTPATTDFSPTSLVLFITLGVMLLLVLFIIPTVIVFAYLFFCKETRSRRPPGVPTKSTRALAAAYASNPSVREANLAKEGTKVVSQNNNNNNNNSAQWLSKDCGSKSGSSKGRKKGGGASSNRSSQNATSTTAASNVSVNGTSGGGGGGKPTKSRRRHRAKGQVNRGSGKSAATSVMSTKSRGSKQSRQSGSSSSKQKESKKKDRKKKRKKKVAMSNKSTRTMASSASRKQQRSALKK